jgi:predicted ATP-grasp superfamily ATP-dependent carboligase
MNGHLRFDSRPDLERPALLCAFQGWNDGGEAASLAARYLMERWDAEPFGRIDAEEFYDFQVNRPTVRLEAGVSRVIDWPHPLLAAASPPGRDVVFLTAPEPSVRWRTFADAVLDCCRELGVETLVTLGAFLTDVPHARPVPVVGSAGDEGDARRLGLSRSRYEGPTGIVGVLHDAANVAGMGSVSLWAAVPHYLPTAPNPKAALALVEGACGVLGTAVSTDALSLAVDRWEHSVARLLEENEELSAYAAGLESDAEAAASGDHEDPEAEPLADVDDVEIAGRLGDMGDEPIPSRDELAAEVERFLKEQSKRDPGAGEP